MRVLITRPEAEALALARRLGEAQIESLIEPMLRIEPAKDAGVELDGVQALLVTSSNGARALARATRRRDLPVYAVGDASAATARRLGFAAVVGAGGDLDALVHEVGARLDPAQGALLHVSGSRVAGDLAGALTEAGFMIRRRVLYEAIPSSALSPECVAALEQGRIDKALFFSPRTAATFVDLTRQAALAHRVRRIDALCLSPAVADAASGLGWRRLGVANSPDQDSLLELLGRGD